MNSLTKTTTVTGTVLIVTLLTLTFFLFTGIQKAGAQSNEPVYEKITPELQEKRRRMAKRAAISAAADMLKKTRVWKRVDDIRKDLREQYAFEYKKRFAKGTGDRNEVKQGPDKKTAAPGELVFSGGLSPNLSPFLSLNSGFKGADIGVRFDVFDHELDCEISSRQVNRMLPGKAILGLSSDGGESEAVLKINFEF